MTTAPSRRCATCDGPLPGSASTRGSAPRYCSNACRQRAYRQRLKSTGVGAGSSTQAQAQAHMSSFVGRTDELVELVRLIGGARLVTVTGPPGSGKTRLALEAASTRQRAGRMTITYAELDGAAGPEEVRQRITRELTRTSDAGRVDRGARLLVLDGCDDLLDACGTALDEAFSGCPDLRVLATSREALRHPGEVVFPIAGLPVPDEETDGAPAEVLRFPAVRLFMDRARAVKPDFRLTAANALHVGALCARLDGLPLAIELAAQQVRAFALEGIHGQLDEAPLHLLTGGWRTAPPRHQSLRAANDSSYDLLTPDERRLFRALAEAPGGFGPDLAAALAGTAVEPRTVPGLLASLAAKSLITAVPDAAGGIRFRMPETLRYSAREHLEDSAERDAVRERAAVWFVKALGDFGETGALSRAGARRLARERTNLNNTLAWLSAGDDERQVPLAAVAETLDMLVGEPAARPLDLAPAVGRAGPFTRLRLGALSARAVLTAWYGPEASARILAQQARTEASRSGDEAQRARMDALLGLLERHERGQAAVRRLRQCLGASRLQDDMPMVALSLHLLARQVLTVGESDRLAETVVDEAITAVRDENAPGPLSPLLLARAALALQTGDHTQAADRLSDLLRSAGEQPLWSAGALEGFAILAARGRAYERALRLLTAAEELRRATPGATSTGWWYRQVNAVRTSVIEALPRKQAAAAVTAGRSLSHRQARDHALDLPSSAERETSPRSALSEREWQVAVSVSQGLTNRQIAEQVYLSPRTIDTHIRNIRSTLGLGSRAQIAAWVVRATSHRAAG
ncbi:ATP-binding protein [Streptomyces sp. AK02-01A]|uniref:ATP-binding protein n=1 Tax=Streptomyces sp. AK02-01A TaxID=3028648 RepID=UPI0029A0DA67|nr:LuxR C-terminal-related transcriptional regulator [Streptomyces sp. AK02-01A]MDX3850974.1 LuxR C-terminal-related transcriptional regulator [Streptomyces sp. AK02-01A]